MDKNGKGKPFASIRERQQEKLNKLKKYLYLKDTYGIKVSEIKSYSLILYGKTKSGKNVFHSKVIMKNGFTVYMKENIEEILF